MTSKNPNVITASSETGSSGHFYILLVSSLLLTCIFYDFPTNESRSWTSLISCFVATVITILNRVDLKPMSTFILAIQSVILNTIAFGCTFSFPLFIISSTITTGVQSFLCLPMKFKN